MELFWDLHQPNHLLTYQEFEREIFNTCTERFGCFRESSNSQNGLIRTIQRRHWDANMVAQGKLKSHFSPRKPSRVNLQSVGSGLDCRGLEESLFFLFFSMKPRLFQTYGEKLPYESCVILTVTCRFHAGATMKTDFGTPAQPRVIYPSKSLRKYQRTSTYIALTMLMPHSTPATLACLGSAWS